MRPATPLTHVTTLCEAFQRTVVTHRDRIALRTVDGSTELTWGGYAEQVRTLAAGLAALGVGRGDTVALMLTNRPEFHLFDTAAMHLGAVPFSIYNSFTAEQISGVCANAGARIVVTEPRFLAQLRAARAGTAIERIVLVEGSAEDAITVAEVSAAADPGFDFEATWQAVTGADLLTLVYTSGTTGAPKGVEITHDSQLAMLCGLEEFAADYPGSEESSISFLPAAHLAERFGFHYWPMLAGATITSVADMSTVMSVLPQVRPTYWGGVPRVWEKAKAAIEAKAATASPVRRVLFERALALSIDRVRAQQRGEDLNPALILLQQLADRMLFAKLRATLGLDRCQYILIGAAPTPVAVLEFFTALGIGLVEALGMTETSGLTTLNPRGRAKIGTVGTALPGVELRCADDGELLVSGPLLMRGYRNEPDKTAEAIDAEGWLHTGDIAEIDADGYVRIVDRKKELIINAAGKNMSPANIEAALTSAHPLIGQAVAIGDARPYNVALIVLDPVAAAAFASTHGIADSALSALADNELIRAAIATGVEAANTRLARVEQIKRFTILGEEWLPGGDELTPTMKLKRKPIAAKYARHIDELYEGIPTTPDQRLVNS
ncbi:AMP-dependent synthetase/ligase [Nocardia sp. NPDC020380]|uniref:AMP-dependent synthetase/ligase n=1 Tax=Nocardia sp. NPDC020380 TaxID=3364309 RepID=UPI0037B27A4E